MANLWYDGFDSYAVSADLASQAYTVFGLGSFSTTGGRFGGGGVQLNNNNSSYIQRTGTFALELWVGWALYITNTNNLDLLLCEFISPAGVEGCLTLNPSTGVLKAWRGSLNTLLGSVTLTGATSSVWRWIDVHFKYDASGGIFEVWYNGVQVLNLTSQNTAQNSSQTSLAAVMVGGNPGSGALGAWIDDLVINDTTGSYNNGRQGDSKIETIKPTSDVTPNNGTPSTAGAHYLMVDEDQWNTSNYITMTNTSGQEELFGMAALSGSPASISAVRVVSLGENTDAGSASLKSVVSSSGTESDGASVNLTSSWTRQSQLYEFDPHTSAAWTVAGINSISVGWKVP